MDFRLGIPVLWLLMVAAAQEPRRDLRLEPAFDRSRRLALVMGNNAYPNAPLINAVNDARAMGKVLSAAGFEVTVLVDADLRRMSRGIDAFLAAIQAGDVAVVFFAGHGIELEQENYIVPVDFDAKDEQDAKYLSYSASRLRDRMEKAGSTLNILILDSCRNNPFRTTRSGARGLAPMAAGRGSFIAFATGPGDVASDNQKAANGLFTAQLVEVLGVAGLSLDDVFKRVRERVYRESQGRQLPWVASNVLGEFYFRPGTPVAAAPAVAAVPAVVESPVVRKETAVAESPRAAFPAVTGNLIAQSPRDGLAYVGILAGSYRQGCTANDTACYGEEKPARAVKLTRPFWMGQTEVTVRAYRQYAQQGRINMPPAPHFNTAWAEADQAMVNVTWDEARMFCEWTGGRLPTEAEWEYAARGGVEGWKYPWGNTITHDNANYGKEKCCGGAVAARDQWLYAAPVGKFERNRLQLYDMAGNVAEWVKDWFAEAYAGGDTDPAGPASGDKRVVRGGSWLQNPWGLRLSARMRLTPGTVSHDVGFRCVVDGPR